MEVIKNQNSTEIETTEVLEGSIWKMLRKVINNDVSNLTKGIGEEDNICHISIRRFYAWIDCAAFFKKPWNRRKVSSRISITFLGEAAVDTVAPVTGFEIVRNSLRNM